MCGAARGTRGPGRPPSGRPGAWWPKRSESSGKPAGVCSTSWQESAGNRRRWSARASKRKLAAGIVRWLLSVFGGPRTGVGTNRLTSWRSTRSVRRRKSSRSTVSRAERRGSPDHPRGAGRRHRPGGVLAPSPGYGPDWWAQAACRRRPDVNFFPDRGEKAAPATALCAECPAREACLAFADRSTSTSASGAARLAWTGGGPGGGPLPGGPYVVRPAHAVGESTGRSGRADSAGAHLVHMARLNRAKQ